MIMRIKILRLLIMFLLPAGVMFSQDFHYSQFYNEPLNFNPALTGAFDGDQRAIMSIRDQYRSVSYPYFTFSGNYDIKLLPNREVPGYFSVGAIFNYDKQGSAHITLFNLNLTGSYTYFVNEHNLLSAGVMLGVANRGFSTEDLWWDSNWSEADGIASKRFPPNEPFDRYRFTYLETGLGVNYRYQHSPRNNFYLGAGLSHLNQPSHNFYSNYTGDDKLDMRFSLLGGANIKLMESLDLLVNALYQKQDVYEETVLGGGLKLYINQKRGKNYAVEVNFMSRLDEGISPAVGFYYNEWFVSMNYDVVTKKNLSDYTNYRGGPEVHVRYILKKVRPLRDLKICPIY